MTFPTYLVVVVVLGLPRHAALELVPVGGHQAVERVPHNEESVQRPVETGVELFQFLCIGDPRIKLVSDLVDPATVSLVGFDFPCLK